ncbi:hypothetical protein Pse7367_3780 (plasmid) [Thalassoporum mexicanum PCC 7367]|uniref:hypothetical protein n=1 Tax=Thalassoporum mexicanum TaxID=3457544 RepID=UPI00029FF31A|nr:hypothetical protein [Pseudanabaena sp. PCC 7367]AFY72004.1 hypothetical protein Pse7367_3780 [Pseudanabaena sp. PCC 7367]
MPEQIIVTGEKGGVGKSFTARALVEYHLDRQLTCIAFDMDRSNPDLKRCYESVMPVRLAVFSESSKLEDAANDTFNSATTCRTICNTPAQTFIPFKIWIEQNDILELAKEASVQLVIWFVSDCGYDSLKLFQRSLHTFGAIIPHVFVKNYGMTEDWEPFEQDETLQQLLIDYQVQVISLPKFVGNRDRNTIDELSLSFGEAREYEGFGAISRQRVKSFLRKCYQEFDRVLTPPVTDKPSRKKRKSQAEATS